MPGATVRRLPRFQSTLPARGATISDTFLSARRPISIHAPRTGSDVPGWLRRHRPTHFNPRSPHGERRRCPPLSHSPSIFQSTLPARGATYTIHAGDAVLAISIHAPRTGSDSLVQPLPSLRRHFNPRSPHGERPRGVDSSIIRRNFNPRSPHGERLRKVTILSIRIIGFAQKVYHKTVLLRISLAENAVILPEKPRNPVRTSLQKAGGLRFARAIRAARPYSISSPSGA